VLTLMRPIQGRATRAAKRHRAHAVKIVHRVHRAEPRHHHFPHRRHLSHAFGTRVVSYARHFIGIPYRYGGSTPGSGFDCSGLVRFVYRHFGITLPHSSYSDLSYGHRVSRGSLRPGDLVFFYGAGHVGIYVGGGRFIDAPHTGARVRISTMGAYSGYYSARRFNAS
jgi:cell wall-associated NlpC family hydrolase